MSTTIRTFMLIIFCCVLTAAKSQTVYVTKFKDEATKKIYITDNPGEADVVVYKSEWKSDAKKMSGVWYFSEWKNDADMLIYFTDYKSEADITICYTSDKNDAVWRKK